MSKLCPNIFHKLGCTSEGNLTCPKKTSVYKYLDPSVDYNCLFKDTAKNEEEILQASRVQRSYAAAWVYNDWEGILHPPPNPNPKIQDCSGACRDNSRVSCVIQ